MALLLVDNITAVHLTRRRDIGCAVTILNQSSVDVYYDTEPGRLNASVSGVIPSGTLLAANGGEKEFTNFPRNGLWFRAASKTTIEVQP